MGEPEGGQFRAPGPGRVGREVGMLQEAPQNESSGPLYSFASLNLDYIVLFVQVWRQMRYYFGWMEENKIVRPVPDTTDRCSISTAHPIVGFWSLWHCTNIF